MRVLGHFFEQPLRLEVFDDSFACLESFQAGVLSGGGAHVPVAGHHVNFRKVVPFTQFEIVRVVRRRHLHRSGSKLAVHERVRHNGYFSIHQGQSNSFADQPLVSLVFGMDGHSGVPQHRLRPRCGHDHILRRANDGIAHEPEISLALLVNRFEVADSGLALRAPVHNIMSAVDESVFVQPHKDFHHHARQFGRKREPLARPITAFPDLPHLFGNGSAVLLLPLPDALLELLSAQFVVVNSLCGKHADHHALR